MTTRIVLTDDLLARALAKRTSHAPSPRLVERIVANATATPQVGERRWQSWRAVPAFAGAIAAVLVVALVIVAIRPPSGPVTTPQPTATPTGGAVSPTSRPNPGPTPEAMLLGTSSALRLPLGTGPIDVVGAFGSIWVAEIFSNRVVRFDGTTLAAIATVRVSGPGWFGADGDSLWVTNQIGNGLTRVDPATNTATDFIGGGPTCGAPVIELGQVFQSLCDADTFIQVDAATAELIRTIPAQGHDFLVAAGGRLITLGPDGLAVLDPATGAFTPLPGGVGAGGQLFESDGEGIWMLVGGETRRLDAVDGHTIAAFPYDSTTSVTVSNGHAWLTQPDVGIVDIGLATNSVIRVIPLLEAPNIARESDGILWVTSFDTNALWRIEP